jgi:hypothetical protein
MYEYVYLYPNPDPSGFGIWRVSTSLLKIAGLIRRETTPYTYPRAKQSLTTWIPALITYAEETTELGLDRAGLDTDIEATTPIKPPDHAYLRTRPR